jgi:hypothetical protein
MATGQGRLLLVGGYWLFGVSRAKVPLGILVINFILVPIRLRKSDEVPQLRKNTHVTYSSNVLHSCWHLCRFVATLKDEFKNAEIGSEAVTKPVLGIVSAEFS